MLPPPREIFYLLMFMLKIILSNLKLTFKKIEDSILELAHFSRPPPIVKIVAIWRKIAQPGNPVRRVYLQPNNKVISS
jgi:hypothetical protein